MLSYVVRIFRWFAFVSSLALVALVAPVWAEGPEAAPAPAVDAGVLDVDAGDSVPLPPSAASVAAEEAPPPPAAAAPEPEAFGAHARAQRAGPAEIAAYGTGSRVNAPLEELPASVTLVDAQQLRERGATNLEQALNLVPGVTPVWTYGGFLYLSMRGFQAVPLIDGYRDTRPLIAGSAPQGAMFDLDRIEVLRGPSSVLYGYGAVGGVVNLIRRQPSRTPEYTLDLGLGLPREQLIHAGAQGPIGSMLAYRVDLGRVTQTDFRGASTERNQASAALLFTPLRAHSFGLRLSYEFDHYNTDVGIPTVENPNKPGAWGLPRGARYEARYNTRNDYLDYQRLEIAGDYRWDISRVTYLQLRANLVHDYYDYLAAESLSYVPAQDMLPAAVDRDYLHFARGWTPYVGQLELHSEANTGPIRHQFVLGYELNGFLGRSDRGDNGDYMPGQVNFAYPVDNAPYTHELQRTSQDHYRHLTHSLYAFDHIHLFKRLILTGGLRFDSVHSRVRRIFYDRETGARTPDPKTGQNRPALEASPSALTGQVGLVFTPWDPFTVYAGYSSAFTPNFVYPSDAQANGYKPERSQQFEGGVRVRERVDGHAFNLDVAAYLIEKRNMLSSRGSDEYDQIGKVQSRGIDAALQYRAPRFVGLDLQYALIYAKFDQFISPDPVTGDNRSLAGRRAPFTPRHSAEAWLRFFFDDHIGAGVGGRWVADQYADQENRLRMPNYALLDMSAWIRGERVSFVISARNLLDKHDYFTSSINSYAENPQVTPGPGREILGTLRLTL